MVDADGFQQIRVKRLIEFHYNDTLMKPLSVPYPLAEDKMDALKRISVLIIDEVSMVDGRLLDYISSVFARLKGNNQPFGNVHVIVFYNCRQWTVLKSSKRMFGDYSIHSFWNNPVDRLMTHSSVF
jgi:hypothetical protein